MSWVNSRNTGHTCSGFSKSAVCGSVEERHGIVLAKNYKAKAFDVKTGDAVWQAKQKCKDLVVVPPHYEEYIKYSKLARSVYERYTDQVEPYGMDECWLDISGTESLFGSPEKVANEIRETMKFELGLTISVGVPVCEVDSLVQSAYLLSEQLGLCRNTLPVQSAECHSRFQCIPKWCRPGAKPEKRRYLLHTPYGSLSYQRC